MEPDQELVIRDYRPADNEVLVELNRYGLAAAGVPEDADIYSGDLDDVGGAYPSERSAMLVGEVKGEVIAMGAVREIDNADCEILRMRVRPAHQGQGLGRAILEALEDRARQLGYTRTVLITGPDQHPAIDLYTSAGYEQVAVERYGDLVGVRMAKQLN
ncbi:MAG: GNAT family N-acetyltransferase [Micromonosporaceae bacterium]